MNPPTCRFCGVSEWQHVCGRKVKAVKGKIELPVMKAKPKTKDKRKSKRKGKP